MVDLLCAILREGPFQWPDHFPPTFQAECGALGASASSIVDGLPAVARSAKVGPSSIVDGRQPNDEAGAVRLYDVAREHGVHLLIAERVWQRGALHDCPPPLRDRLVTALRNQLAVEEFARQELRSVLAALNEAGIAPLLFKGTALAFTHYQDPALRPRVDTDLLIDPSEIQSAGATLERLGYRRAPFTSGDLVMYQAPYSRTDRRGIRHAIDVHWRVSNPQVFASALTIEELRTRATAIPALGSTAQAVGSVHALALACIHRVAHHSDEERLIWIYDIHLIAERLTAVEQGEFVDLARAKELTAVCADGLALAERTFLGRGSASLVARLGSQSSPPDGGHDHRAKTRERSEIYVTGKMRKVDVLVSDLQALEGWRAKVKLLREHVLPPASYMREAYGISNSALLPFFYIWRFARGAGAWWRGGKG
jgi:putative nucleotidyltransferase-like protein